MRRILLALALFALPACTREEISGVEQAYRAAVEAEAARAEQGPTWSVEAGCTGATVTLSGWTATTALIDGMPYASFVMGGGVPLALKLDSAGSRSGFVPLDVGEPASYGWHLWIIGTALDVAGESVC